MYCQNVETSATHNKPNDHKAKKPSNQSWGAEHSSECRIIRAAARQRRLFPKLILFTCSDVYWYNTIMTLFYIII